MTRRHLALLLVLWQAFQPAAAGAFSLIGPPFRKWLTADIPPGGVPFVIDDRGDDSVTPADGSSDRGLTQVIAAVQLWNEAAGRTLTAAPVRTSITTLHLSDGRNSIVFNDPLGVCTGSCLAVTFIGSFDAGSTEVTNGITFSAYRETDITFNASVDWTTHTDAGGSGCAGEFDIEAVALHEMGHALGLGHSSNPAATMAAFTSACTPGGIPLDPDDVAAIRCAYVQGAGCSLCENCPAVVPPVTLACGGADFVTMTLGISSSGNLVRFESPRGVEHLGVGVVREGAILCYTADTARVAYDVHDQAAGFEEPSFFQSNGPNTVPIEIFRSTGDGILSLRQRYTGSSFVGDGPAFDLNGDGVACSTLEECGNCTNRTAHLLMEVRNLSDALVTNVVLVRVADLDVAGASVNRFARTADSVQVWRDAGDGSDAHGMVMQAILGQSPAQGLVQTPARSGSIDCLPESVATPDLGDFVGKLRWTLGDLMPGETKQVRMHYRRW